MGLSDSDLVWSPGWAVHEWEIVLVCSTKEGLLWRPCNLIEIVRDFNKQCLEWHGQSTTVLSIYIRQRKIT